MSEHPTDPAYEETRREAEQRFCRAFDVWLEKLRREWEHCGQTQRCVPAQYGWSENLMMGRGKMTGGRYAMRVINGEEWKYSLLAKSSWRDCENCVPTMLRPNCGPLLNSSCGEGFRLRKLLPNWRSMANTS